MNNMYTVKRVKMLRLTIKCVNLKSYNLCENVENYKTRIFHMPTTFYKALHLDPLIRVKKKKKTFSLLLKFISGH